MFYLPDGTTKCGFYECKRCDNRFLSLQTMKKIPCPSCAQDIDYEIGPDESLDDILDSAELIQVIEGEEEIKKWMDCYPLPSPAEKTNGSKY